jgi:hypothetical protein
LARILNGFSTPDLDGDDLIQTHISSHSLPALLLSAQGHEGQPSESLNLPSSVQSIQATSESIIDSDMDTTSAILEQRDEGPDSECQDNYGGIQPRNLGSQLHDSHIPTYLIKKTGEVAEHLLKDWGVRKTIILVIIFIVLYQLCTTLLHALQVDQVIV